VKYFDYFLHLIFWYKDFYKRYIRSGAKESFKIQIRNCCKSLKCRVLNKIGGGHHSASIEKIRMDVISPFVILAPVNHFDIKIWEFVEYLEMSEGFKKYNDSHHVICILPLHLLVDCLFQNSRISIGHKHSINILKKMTKLEITKLFKIYDSVCELQYVSVFCLYKKVSSSEHSLEYHKSHNSAVINNPVAEQLKYQKVNVPSYEAFPPTPPDPLLRKIMDEFCEATSITFKV
jgi:hypothetical protein